MSRPLTIPRGKWLALIERAGDVTRLAAELGVARSTLHRWIAGNAVLSPLARDAVSAYARRHRLAEP